MLVLLAKEDLMQATEDKRYNGWSNYETWNVKLWIDNDLYEVVREFATEQLQNNDERSARAELAEWLKEMIEEQAPALEASTYADLLTAAISRVDWYEIAENLLSE